MLLKRAVCNGRQRGYVSRAGAALIGGFDHLPWFHHHRVVHTARFVGPAMAYVPRVGRFLQDGFTVATVRASSASASTCWFTTYKRRNRYGENPYYVACTRHYGWCWRRWRCRSGACATAAPAAGGCRLHPQPAAAGGWPATTTLAALPCCAICRNCAGFGLLTEESSCKALNVDYAAATVRGAYWRPGRRNGALGAQDMRAMAKQSAAAMRAFI